MIDAHHHLWDPATADYPWMTDDLAAIRRRFGPEDLEPLAFHEGIDATVVVQTRSSEEETVELLVVAAGSDLVAGVVGWVDLTAPDVGERIGRLRGGPGGEHLVGIRHQVHDEQDASWLERADVQRGLRAVASAGLVFELLVRTREMTAATAVARALPELRFVLDHCGKPPLAEGDTRPWEAAVASLAESANVSCKVSGLVTEDDPVTWRSGRRIGQAFERVLHSFGPTRLLAGSDWPVCLLVATYAEVWELNRSLLSDLTAEERDGVLGANAAAVYGLSVDGGGTGKDRPAAGRYPSRGT